MRSPEPVGAGGRVNPTSAAVASVAVASEAAGMSGGGEAINGQCRVAFDITALAGTRTGVAALVEGFFTQIKTHSGIQLVPYATTIRGHAALHRAYELNSPRLPARALRYAWRNTNWPPIEALVGDVNIVHGMNYVVPPTRHAQAIVSIHDLTFVRYPEMCTADTLQYSDLLKKAFQRGAHVHVDSIFVANEVQEWSGLSPDRIHVVSPGVGSSGVGSSGVGSSGVGSSGVGSSGVVSAVGVMADGIGSQPMRTAIAELLADVSTKPFILGLGTIEPRKGFVTLLQAFSELSRIAPELLLVIAGANGWGMQDFTSMLQTFPKNIRERVHCVGYVSDRERQALLANARCLAYPSVYEGFGLPPLEAMAVGTPVVATTAGSLPEVLGDAALFANVSDPADLAERLLCIHSKSELRTTLVDRGKQNVMRYTWTRAGSEMAALYSKLRNHVS
jgi:glycosyltransferase involved in cell wall biosynthesis